MTGRAKGIKVSNVKRSRIYSREIGLGPREGVSGPVSSLTAECLHCGNQWDAKAGRRPGQIATAIGEGIAIDCPKCQISEIISPAEFK